LSTYGSGTYGSGTYGGAVALVRDANLSAQRARELSEQLTSDVSAEEVAVKNPDVASLVMQFVRRYGVGGVTILLTILTVWLQWQGNQRAEDLARQQIEIEEEDLEVSKQQLKIEREAAQQPTTANLTDEDVERIARAVSERIAAAKKDR
jgi:NACalpha-BTF3-like transcription factor